MKENIISITDIEKTYVSLLQEGYILEQLHISPSQRLSLQKQIEENLGRVRVSTFISRIDISRIMIMGNLVDVVVDIDSDVTPPYFSRKIKDSSISLVVQVKSNP